MSGVRGGEGERLLGRRMEGRNLRSRSRRGGVRSVRVPTAELAGEMSGVGEPAGGRSPDSPRRERRVRWKEALRRFRRRSQSSAREMIRISARIEHTPTATLPCAVRLLPVVVDAAVVGDGSSVATGGADVGCEPATPGVGFACVVVAVGWVVLVGIDAGDVLNGGPGVAAGTARRLAEQPAVRVLVSVLHLKPGGGGPGSRIE